MKVTVLRLGHRKERDKRITTHCALVARQWGASGIVICGEDDPEVKKSIQDVVKRWGGKFAVSFVENWEPVVKKAKRAGKIAHLTFYGSELKTGIARIKKAKPKELLLVIGASKVPSEIYKLADYNISVGNQPHSEVAALAIILDKLLQVDLYRKFPNAKIRIKPSENCKSVENV